jgi:predicted acylesterase/phospholipase RssA
VNECIEAYLELSKEVFKVDQLLVGHIPMGDDCCRFDYNILERVIKRIIQAKLGDENCGMNAIPANKTCRTFVVAKTIADVNAPPTIFRTYHGRRIRPSECALWQAARATSAAPTFFKPMSIDRPRPPITYVDGGMGHNNPSEVALDEARRIWPSCTQFGLVSIGTGRTKANPILFTDAAETNASVQKSLFDDIKSYIPTAVTRGLDPVNHSVSGVKALIGIARVLSQLAHDSEGIHQRVQRSLRSTQVHKQRSYFRFNVSRDVGDIGLGDWKKSDEMAAHTSNYTKEYEVEERLDRCVEFLMSASPPSGKCPFFCLTDIYRLQRRTPCTGN